MAKVTDTAAPATSTTGDTAPAATTAPSAPTAAASTASAPAETDTLPLKKDISSIKYVGTSDVRLLSVSDLERHGFELKEDLRWDADNDFAVKVDNIPAPTLEFFALDSEFELV